jgi:hypothetical protein
MRVSTLSDVVIDGGIAAAVWATAKRGSTNVAQTTIAASCPISFMARLFTLLTTEIP